MRSQAVLEEEGVSRPCGGCEESLLFPTAHVTCMHVSFIS